MSESKELINPQSLGPKEIVDVLYADIKKSVITDQFTMADAVTVTAYAMTFIKKYQNLTGSEKKYIVESVIRRLVSEIPGTQSEKNAYVMATNVLLPNIIDALAAVAKNGLDANGDGVVDSQDVKACFPCCC